MKDDVTVYTHGSRTAGESRPRCHAVVRCDACEGGMCAPFGGRLAPAKGVWAPPAGAAYAVPMTFFRGLLNAHIATPAATPSTVSSRKNASCDHRV